MYYHATGSRSPTIECASVPISALRCAPTGARLNSDPTATVSRVDKPAQNQLSLAYGRTGFRGDRNSGPETGSDHVKVRNRRPAEQWNYEEGRGG